MPRRAAIPIGLVWLLTVVGTWVLTTAALAALNGGHVGQSALSAALACLVVGGPATAAALHVRRRRAPGPAALTGLAVAGLILVFLWSFMAASGTALRGTWSAVPPALIVTAVELAVAFALRGRRPPPQPLPPPPEPPTESERSQRAATGREI
jgi:hypothetical protein